MNRLQLIRGRSYTCVYEGRKITISADRPFFETDDRKITDAFIATGRFSVIGNSDTVGDTGTGGAGTVGETGADGKGFEIKELQLDKMTAAELDAYAEKNGIDITGLAKKADKLARIQEALVSGSGDAEMFSDDNA